MTSHLRGNRTETFRWELLSRNDESPMGILDGVESGRVTYSVQATYRASGSLSWAGATMPDWNAVRVQPWYRAEFDDGHVEEWPLGVFIPTTPGEEHDETGMSVDVDIYDKLLLLDQAKIEHSWSMDVGANVAMWIEYWIKQTAGIGTRVQVEPNDERARLAMVWEAGTSHLRIVNDLCAVINYFAVWADGWGTVRAEPYRAPASRSVAWDFRRGENCIYEPRFRRDRDTASVPNKVILVSTSDGETEALTAYATDESPESDTSFPSRGYWVTLVDTNVEATSQAVLDDLAVRRLLEARQVATTFRVTHAPLPLMGNEVVTFVHDLHGIETRCAVQTVEVPLGNPGSMWTTTLREVVS